MKRRDYIKTIMLGSVMPFTTSGYGFGKLVNDYFIPAEFHFQSNWEEWPNMKWVGPQYWGNRLQDWKIENGKLVCDYSGNFRTLHLLTIQNKDGDAPFKISVNINKLNPEISNFSDGCVGLLLGAKGPFEDYRSAAVFGKGLNIGLTPKGALKIGDKIYDCGLKRFPEGFSLEVENVPNNSENRLNVKVFDSENSLLCNQENIGFSVEKLAGNIALIADLGVDGKEETAAASVSFEKWKIGSSSFPHNPSNLFGPVCFAQYTLHNNTLKLTGQFAPIEEIADHKVLLQFQDKGSWDTYEETRVTHAGRAINFQVSHWNRKETPYRIKVLIPVGSHIYEYVYQGTIAEEPKDKDKLKVAVFSCNAHYGFPDSDIPIAIEKLNPDMSVFLGDQFYEGTGGYGVQFKGDFDKQCLDYLRKWLMFGWSYREIYRHIPCAIIPDDHDVYHGNLWGEKGKKADVSKGFGAYAQDSGGYKMNPEWVNMVQFTQTSHLPDPYDPTPVKNNIGVYYTKWNYAGISFAILEDRKFKSAPKHVLPAEAEVHNGWIYNEDFDIKKYSHLKADLLGVRQEEFLEQWVEDWEEETLMKAVLSQTNFATVATLPKGSKDGSVIPGLKIPARGEYIKGDRPTVDMDSNGWPKLKRDKAVEIIRKAMAFHIAGDQHLGSFIQYGVDNFEDGSFAFAGPALNNLWPRRFWPPVEHKNHTYENPAYTGNHIDGFGNYFTLHAVGNPYDRDGLPKVLYTRANGYGMVTFNKRTRTIETSCYERFKDPLEIDSQYPGWPITIKQEENCLKNADYYLTKLIIKNRYGSIPLLKVYDSDSNLVYVFRLPSNTYQPKVRKSGTYRIVLIDMKQQIKEEFLTEAKRVNKELKIIEF